ncbi:hypothetical protein DAPPUDRAFT_115523 [Daphnia pulex]|uniref:Uncharacterized protein n=1 Tax=Daphnia pulex TaxID=6669 RepID=E9HLP3_DAPPU|nr:hypothetical protein DAPPUDRAFT_115523 [Daphnia pulex]|eukprot:EFX67340.1 hypothetical protein DAPPUDRAFT_115523 [Daphnia pulex]
MINLVEEQHDVDIQHEEDQPMNVLEPADEPPNLDMEIGDDHQVVELENLPLPQNAQRGLEDNALLPEVIEPLDQHDTEQENALRRSDRTPKYSARYQEFRRSLGLTTLIGKLNVKLNICREVN